MSKSKLRTINEDDSSRTGDDISATNIASAMSNIPFLKYAIRREKSSTSIYDKQYWANRMYNVDSVAKLKTNRFFEKEVENLTSVTDMANKARAMTGDIDLSDDEYISVKAHTLSVDIPVSANTRFGYKDPAVIAEFIDFMKEAYRRMGNEDRQAGYDGDHQKILTFFVLHAGLDDHLEGKFRIPYEKEVQAAVRKAGVTSNKIINIDKVCAALGISKVKYTTVIKNNLRATMAIMMKTTVADLEKGRPQRLKLIESLVGNVTYELDTFSESMNESKYLSRDLLTRLNNSLKSKKITLTPTDIIQVAPVLIELNRIKKTAVFKEFLTLYGSNVSKAGNKFIKEVLKSRNPKDKSKSLLSRLITDLVVTPSHESVETKDHDESISQMFVHFVIDHD